MGASRGQRCGSGCEMCPNVELRLKLTYISRLTGRYVSMYFILSPTKNVVVRPNVCCWANVAGFLSCKRFRHLEISRGSGLSGIVLAERAFKAGGARRGC